MSLPPFLDLMRGLIAAPSVSSVSPGWDQSNELVVDRLAEWAAELGLRTEKRAVPGHPGKYNLLACAGSSPDGLVLAGHTDTVPCYPGDWASDPFQLRERDQYAH